jgi:hypothetical protein
VEEDLEMILQTLCQTILIGIGTTAMEFHSNGERERERLDSTMNVTGKNGTLDTGWKRKQENRLLRGNI